MAGVSPAPPRLDDQLCFAIYAASRTLVKAYEPLLTELGLTYAQFLVMMVLWEEDGRSVGELGARLLLDSGTLTPLLKRLARAELVVRTRDPDDERRVLVHLTARGSALGDTAARRHAELLCTIAPSRRTDLADLRDALTRLTRSLRAR